MLVDLNFVAVRSLCVFSHSVQVFYACSARRSRSLRGTTFAACQASRYVLDFSTHLTRNPRITPWTLRYMFRLLLLVKSRELGTNPWKRIILSYVDHMGKGPSRHTSLGLTYKGNTLVWCLQKKNGVLKLMYFHETRGCILLVLADAHAHASSLQVNRCCGKRPWNKQHFAN